MSTEVKDCHFLFSNQSDTYFLSFNDFILFYRKICVGMKIFVLWEKNLFKSCYVFSYEMFVLVFKEFNFSILEIFYKENMS